MMLVFKSTWEHTFEWGSSRLEMTRQCLWTIFIDKVSHHHEEKLLAWHGRPLHWNPTTCECSLPNQSRSQESYFTTGFCHDLKCCSAVTTNRGAILPAWHACQAQRVQREALRPAGRDRERHGWIQRSTKCGACWVLSAAAHEVSHRSDSFQTKKEVNAVISIAVNPDTVGIWKLLNSSELLFWNDRKWIVQEEEWIDGLCLFHSYSIYCKLKKLL